MMTTWGFRTAAGALVVLFGGCVSEPHADAPPASDSARAEASVGADAPGWSETRVKTSARYVRFQQPSVEVARLLAELGDNASLRAGTVVLSKAQADAVYTKLEHAKGTTSGATLAVTVASGNTARMTSGELGGPQSGAGAAVTISSGAATHSFEPRTLGASLELTPRVLADNVTEMKTEVQVTAFEGFVEYGGGAATMAAVSIPEGFHQPIFSTATVRAEVRAPSGSVIVVMVDEEAEMAGRETTSERALTDKPSGRETWVLFIHVEAAPVKR